MRHVPVLSACLITAVVASHAQAQSLSERIQIIKEQRSQADQAAQAQPPVESLEIPRKMSTLINEVYFDQAPAHEVFQWWSAATEIPLVIDWNRMELDGIDPEQALTMDLKTVPARLLLKVIMQQTEFDAELIYEVTPWYVQVMTKRQANRNPILRVYDVSDIVMTIPNFTQAPQMGLADVLGNDGGGNGGLFDDENEDEEDRPTKNERGQAIADMIRETIEPDIWQANGGFYASARYYDGRLIVNAPLYVHQQIGMPESRAFRSRSIGGHKSAAGGTQAPSVGKPFGVQPK